MILHLYFARRFLQVFGMLSVVMFALIGLIDLIEQTRAFAPFDIGFPRVLGLTFLKVPTTFNQIMPLIVILSTVALFVSLARSSEMVITRAIGRSALTTLLSPAVLALMIGAIAVTVLSPIAAGLSKRYDAQAEQYRSGGESTLSISEEGLWLRQGSESGQVVINAKYSNADGSVLYGVTFLAFDADFLPLRRIAADSASLEAGAWRLLNAKEWPLRRGVNPEASSEVHPELTLSSTLTIDQIRESLGRPGAISIWDLPEFIKRLDQAGFSSREHRVHFQSELARPVFLLAMVLVAAAFTMRHARGGGTGLAVLITVLLGFGLYFVRSFAQILGENGQIPISLAAWAPPIAAVLLGLGLLLHAEDG